MAKQGGPPVPFSIPGGGRGDFLDRYMSADDKLLVVGQQLEALTALVQSQLGGQMTSGRTQEIVFQQILAIGQQLRVTQPMPFNGYISKILRHWPAGCNGLVDLAVGAGNKHILPESGFVSLDNATPVFDNLHVPVGQGQLLWVLMANGDALNPHTPSVTITIEEIVGGGS
jgi:hypothetical protein